MNAIGIFGGTFDPIHNAHIAMAQQARQLLGLDEVRLLPCHQPPHRDQPLLTSAQRLQLLQLAIADEAGLTIDDRELHRDKPSWTVDTLEDMRIQWGNDVSLVLLMGADAFAHLESWHRWQALPALAHIAVLQRPDYALPATGPLAQWLHESKTIDAIHQKPAGVVVALTNDCQPESATAIRQQLALGRMPVGLPLPVQQFIAEHRLYGYQETTFHDS